MLKHIKIFLLGLFCICKINGISAQSGLYLPLNEEARLNLEQYFFEATKNKLLGNIDLAERDLLKCLEIYPKHQASLYILGSICIEKRELSRAVEYLKFATELEPVNIWYWKKLIEVYKLKKDFVAVAKVYEKLTYYFPLDKENYKSAATFWSSTGNLSKAIKILKKSEKKFGISEDISIELERLYIYHKEPEKALRQLQKLRKTDTTNVHYIGLLADLYTDLGFEIDAFVLYQTIIRKDPQNGLAHFALSDHYHAKKQEAKSIAEIKLGLADPKVSCNYKIPLIHEKIQESYNLPMLHEELSSFFAILEKTHPDVADVYYLHANYLFKNGKFSESIYYFEKCMENGNVSEELLSQMAQADYKAKNYEKLSLHTAIGIEFYPLVPFFYYYQSVAETRMANYTAALQVAYDGIHYAIDDPYSTEQLLKALGNAAFQLKNFALADSAYHAGFLLDSFDITLCNNYANTLAVLKKDLDKALRISAKTIEEMPDNAAYLDTYGFILYTQGKYEFATPYLKSAMENDGTDGLIVEHYGDNQFKLGNIEEAIRYWKEALYKSGHSSQLERKIKEQKMVE